LGWDISHTLEWSDKTMRERDGTYNRCLKQIWKKQNQFQINALVVVITHISKRDAHTHTHKQAFSNDCCRRRHHHHHQLNSFRTAHERMLVCRVLFCRPRMSACTFVTCTYIFTLANSFSYFFLIKSAREVSDNFLPHILNIWFERFSWIFLLFWDGECAQNKRLTWPSKWGWAFRQWVCFWQWVCTCRAARKQQKHG
jgi:hypothetical protein